MKIVLSRIARQDLNDIVDYIKRDSIKYANLEKKKIQEAIDKLQNNLCREELSLSSMTKT